MTGAGTEAETGCNASGTGAASGTADADITLEGGGRLGGNAVVTFDGVVTVAEELF